MSVHHRLRWFLAHQGVPSESGEARERGTADHAVRAIAVQRGRSLDALGRRLLVLAAVALLILLLAKVFTR
jgi:hypothetical protein